MPVDLHYICKHGDNHQKIGDQLFETGNWTATDQLADEAIGGRIYLHEKQNENAWHGGTVTQWRNASDGKRKVFTFLVDGPFRIKCSENWAQERAIIRR